MVTFNGSSSPGHRLSPDPAFPLDGTSENRTSSLSGCSFEHKSAGSFHVKSTGLTKSPIFKPGFSKWPLQTPIRALFSPDSPVTPSCTRVLRGGNGAESVANVKQMMIPSSTEWWSLGVGSAPGDRIDPPQRYSSPGYSETQIAALSLKSDDPTKTTESIQLRRGDAIFETSVPKNRHPHDKREYVKRNKTPSTRKDTKRAEYVEISCPKSGLQPTEESEVESLSFYYCSEDMELQDVPPDMLDSTASILIDSNTSSSVSIDEIEVGNRDQDASPRKHPGAWPGLNGGDRPTASSREATEADARKYSIPAEYSLRYWNPEEEPLILLGCVFDAESLGRWIHRWTARHYGKVTPIAEMAEELHRLLLELSTKLKLASDSVTCVAGVDDRATLKDFIDAGDRLTDRLCSLLKRCEKPILKAAKAQKSVHRIEESGTEFVQTIFGREKELERTEQLMTSIRLWSFRFDVNCRDILRSIQSTSKPASVSCSVSSSEHDEDLFVQNDPFRSSPMPERERSCSAESMDDDATDATTSDVSYISDDFGEAEFGEAVLGDGHPFLYELPGLVELVLEKLEEWCATRQRDGSPGSQGARNPGNLTGPSSGQRQPKRDRATDDETGFGDDGRLSTTRQGKKTKRDDAEEKTLLLACPFYKKDKLRHKGCLRYQLTRIKDVKQHLCRRHMQAQSCPVCGLEFESQSEQRDHIRAQLCPRREVEEPEGITEDQKKALSSRVSRIMSLEQQWYAVWDVVFPDVEHPSSVYVQDEIAETLCNFQEFVDQHAQTLIAERLRSRELPYNMPNEERDLAALLAMTAAGVLDSLIEQYTSSIFTSASDDQATPPALVDDESATQNGPGSIDQYAQHAIPRHLPELLPLPEAANTSKGQTFYEEPVFNLASPESSLAWARAEDGGLGFDTYLDFTTLGTINEQLE